VVEGRVLMLRPAGRDDLKFPGGGVEAGEADEVALARELAEECGYALVRVRGRAVDTYERRPATERPGAVFEMVSHYYWCEVDDAGLDRRLDGYEAALRLAPEWTPIDAAVAACRRAAAAAAALPWAPRELAVLEWLVSRPLEA
jgi:8-oxo-dGTP pyrophosphatase MutT (NUDIX family)